MQTKDITFGLQLSEKWFGCAPERPWLDSRNGQSFLFVVALTCTTTLLSGYLEGGGVPAVKWTGHKLKYQFEERLPPAILLL